MLLDEWVSAAGDIASAYFCERRSDDPAMYRRVVICEKADHGPSYLIHTAVSLDIWVKLNVRQTSKPQSFNTLREALNSVRPVLQN
jgi:hypothetical protein